MYYCSKLHLLSVKAILVVEFTVYQNSSEKHKLICYINTHVFLVADLIECQMIVLDQHKLV